MIIIGVDYHSSFQQIAFMYQKTAECGEGELNHSDGEAERFYRELKQRGVGSRVGMEATGHSRLVRDVTILVSAAIEIRNRSWLNAEFARSRYRARLRGKRARKRDKQTGSLQEPTQVFPVLKLI
jgi:hypothetical protein